MTCATINATDSCSISCTCSQWSFFRALLYAYMHSIIYKQFSYTNHNALLSTIGYSLVIGNAGELINLTPVKKQLVFRCR
ncbi:hypothetical protein BDV40DRAFT_95030 [Aspergillus tamarii]|uniref:Uncharacterized protein n=1 Tax=Aspergillus tamarii TaxID=41984 RepID=A0A5N6VBZ8_ASPTM|nr:hypothetical protein BDV40DRAFT_95030 [Aspergillus tamarii]